MKTRLIDFQEISKIQEFERLSIFSTSEYLGFVIGYSNPEPDKVIEKIQELLGSDFQVESKDTLLGQHITILVELEGLRIEGGFLKSY